MADTVQDCLDVRETLLRLLSHAAGYQFAGLRIDGELS
jgi:hypothetical protein